jgi:hypothetical protein
VRLHSSTERALAREGAQVVRRPGDSGGAADTAETEDRRALHVAAQAQAIRETRIERRRGDARDGEREDRIHVARFDLGGGERVSNRALAELEPAADERGVRCAEPAQRFVLLDRKCEVPPADERVALNLFQAPRVVKAPGPQLFERAA